MLPPVPPREHGLAYLEPLLYGLIEVLKGLWTPLLRDEVDKMPAPDLFRRAPEPLDGLIDRGDYPVAIDGVDYVPYALEELPVPGLALLEGHFGFLPPRDVTDDRGKDPPGPEPLGR